MRMDPTQPLGLRISASKLASWFEKRTTFDLQKLFWGCGKLTGTLFRGFEPKKNFGSRDMGSGDFGSPMGTPGAKTFFCLKVHMLCRCPWYSLFGTFPTFVPMGTWFLGPMTSHFTALCLGLWKYVRPQNQAIRIKPKNPHLVSCCNLFGKILHILLSLSLWL